MEPIHMQPRTCSSIEGGAILPQSLHRSWKGAMILPTTVLLLQYPNLSIGVIA
jgi:hypothetical protein